MEPSEEKWFGTSVFRKWSWYVCLGGGGAVSVPHRPDRGLRPGFANSSPGARAFRPHKARLHGREPQKAGSVRVAREWLRRGDCLQEFGAGETLALPGEWLRAS